MGRAWGTGGWICQVGLPCQLVNGREELLRSRAPAGFAPGLHAHLAPALDRPGAPPPRPPVGAHFRVHVRAPGEPGEPVRAEEVRVAELGLELQARPAVHLDAEAALREVVGGALQSAI